MRKKYLTVVSAVIVATMLFAGCGNKNNENKNGSGSAAIHVISREDGSGTRGAFTELLGIVDSQENDITVDTAEITNSTSVMITTVAGDKSAIGYISLGTLNDAVKAVKVDGADATKENVKSGDYKISRPFNIAYKEKEASDLVIDFISYIMSAEGQKVVNDEGYISMDTDSAYKPSGKKGKITIAGSTSIAPLMDVLADDYKKLNPGVTVEMQESGSSAGIQSAIEGAAQLAMSSRELKDDETKELTAKQIALDGIAVIVNNDSVIDDMTSDQIKKIYTGEITKWSEVK